jgi:hypothetical protein
VPTGLTCHGNFLKLEGCLRYDAGVVEFTGVELDYDGKLIDGQPFYYDEAVKKAEEMGSRCELYTTPTHTLTAPRWRLLLLVSKPETRLFMRKKYAARVNGFFGNIFSNESFTISQPHYYGAAEDNKDRNHRADMIDGKFIDLQDELYKYEQDGMPKADKAKANDNEPDWENVGGYHSGRGFDAIIAELGDGPDLNGFHDPLCAGVASYVMAHRDDLDRKQLKTILRERIDAAQGQEPQGHRYQTLQGRQIP